METNKKIWFLIGLIMTLGIILTFGINWNYYFGFECYDNTAILHNQEIRDLKGCCNNCLVLNVSEFVCKGNPGDGCGCEYVDKMLFFETENKTLKNIENKTEINIKWCYVKDIKDYRIRKIY